jgi:non-ribosomal peptide synthetase component F
LFQVNFRAPNQPYPCLQFDGVTATPAQYLDNGTAKFDLALELESATGRACYFEYATDLFREQTIAQMEADFLNLLPALVAQPDKNLSSVSAVTAISQRIWQTGKVLR